MCQWPMFCRCRKWQLFVPMPGWMDGKYAHFCYYFNILFRVEIAQRMWTNVPVDQRIDASMGNVWMRRADSVVNANLDIRTNYAWVWWNIVMQIHAKMGQPASMIWADMIAFVYRVILLNSIKFQFLIKDF